MSAPARRLVTLPVNGAWQPVYKHFQFKDRTADFYCYPSRFVVDNGATTFHGKWWHEEDAKRFAASMWGQGCATVREVEVYWYQPTYGRVKTEETREETVSASEQGS